MLRIGIIGAGMMGRSHAQAVKTYGAQVAAVQDVRLESAEKLAEETGAEIATESLEAFFDRDLDGVVLATPPPVRVDPVRRACERGIPLMIEKPPALTLAEGRECLRHIESSGVLAAVGFQLRYAPLYERLKEMLEGETVHLVRTVCTIDYYLNYKMSPWFLQNAVSGGPIAEQAIHLLDCVRFVLGNARPVQAHALAAKNMALERTEFDAENAVQMTYELTTHDSRLTTHATRVFGVHTNHCGTERFRFDLEAIGPHLALQANVTNNRITGYLNGRDVDEPAPASNALGLDKTGAWLRAIETGDRSLARSNFAESLHTLALVEAAVQSRHTGQFVRAEEWE
jgi:predicted dehydrogenase